MQSHSGEKSAVSCPDALPEHFVLLTRPPRAGIIAAKQIDGKASAEASVQADTDGNKMQI